MRAFVPLVLAAALTGCLVHHPRLPPRQGGVSNRTLQYPSGLRVVIEPEPGSKRIAVAVLVGAGSAQDPNGKEGLAHFLEHLVFRSKPANRLSAWDELDYAGLASQGSSQVNAYTRPETTTFLGIAPSGSAMQVLPLMASLVVRPLQGVDDAVLEVERNVVRRERFDSDPHAGGAVLDAVSAVTLPKGYPGSRPVGGTEASLTAITRADLEAFTYSYYQPANTVVVLVGDLPSAAADALVSAAFPKEWLSAPQPVTPRNVEGAVAARVPNPPLGEDRPIIESRVKHRRLMIAWAVPGLAQPAGPAMPLVRDAFSDALKKPKGVRHLSTSLLLDVRTSLLLITAELEDDAKPDEVRDELRKTRNFGSFTVGDWAEAAQRSVLGEQQMLDRAEDRALAVFATGQARPMDRGPTPERLASLKTVEKDVLLWARSREVLVVPFVRTTPPADQALPEAIAPKPHVALDAAALKMVALGPPVGKTRHFTLENGLEVFLSQRPSLPVASVALGLPGRALHAARDVDALLDGTLRWDFDDETWRVGRPDVTVTADATVASLAGESRDVPLMLDVLGHNLPPRISWTAVDTLSDIVEALDKAVGRLDDDEREAWAPGLAAKVMPPFSSAVPATLEELKSLERGRFVDFVDLAWRPDGAWLVVDGDIDLDDVERIVRDDFTRWSRGGSPLPASGPAGQPPARARTKVVENQDAAVTQVRFVCRVPSGAAADLGGVALLEHALVSHFEDSLRRELGLTYLVDASTTRYRHEDNLLRLSMTLNPANHQDALKRFLAMLQDLDGAVWDEQQVNVARWHVAKEAIGTRLTSGSVAFDLAEAGASGLPLEQALSQPWVLSQAPLPAVDDAWSACNDTWVMEVEGERSSIETALRAAKLLP